MPRAESPDRLNVRLRTRLQRRTGAWPGFCGQLARQASGQGSACHAPGRGCRPSLQRYCWNNTIPIRVKLTSKATAGFRASS